MQCVLPHRDDKQCHVDKLPSHRGGNIILNAKGTYLDIASGIYAKNQYNKDIFEMIYQKMKYHFKDIQLFNPIVG